jgi:hypothetical protein
MKKIGFLSFGHWTPSPQSANDALLQSIDLAVEAERLGMDGAYFLFTTSRGNWHRRFHSSRRLVLKRERLKSAPQSSTCGMRILITPHYS